MAVSLTVTGTVSVQVPGLPVATFHAGDVIDGVSPYFAALASAGAGTVTGAPGPPPTVDTVRAPLYHGSEADGNTIVWSGGRWGLASLTGTGSVVTAVDNGNGTGTLTIS